MSDTGSHTGHLHSIAADGSITEAHKITESMMHMMFSFSTDVVLLFEFWHPRNVLGMLVSCTIIFVLAAALEAIRGFRQALHLQTRQTGSNLSLIGSRLTNHIVQTLLYTLQVIMSYVLMLLFMTFNGYVCIAIILGATVGFFAFGWKESMMLDVSTEHCR